MNNGKNWKGRGELLTTEDKWTILITDVKTDRVIQAKTDH